SDLSQDPQQLPEDGRLKERKSRDVATRTCEALDPACLDRVADPRNDDRDRTSQLNEYWNAPAPTRDDDVRIEFHQIDRVGPNQLHVVGRPALVELDVHAFRPSQSLQLLLERLDAGLHLRVARGGGQG